MSATPTSALAAPVPPLSDDDARAERILAAHAARLGTDVPRMSGGVFVAQAVAYLDARSGALALDVEARVLPRFALGVAQARAHVDELLAPVLDAAHTQMRDALGAARPVDVRLRLHAADALVLDG